MAATTGQSRSRTFVARVILAWALGGGCVRGRAQAPPVIPTLSIKQLIAEAADKEIHFLQYGEPYMSYRMHTVDAKGDQLREVVQSREGAVARLLERDNRPLTPEEDAAERQRLQGMLDSPEAFTKHARAERGNKKLAIELIRLLPNAMLYTFTDGQPQRRQLGKNDRPEIVIDYTPNPAWKPPTMASAALTGLQGRMWFDPRTHTLVAIEGHIFRGVNFGLGVIAHIYPGGDLSMEQAEVIPGKWSFTRFVEHLTVRALMVKTLHQDANTTASGFAPVNPMSYQDAIRLLLAMPLPGRATTP